MEVILLEKIDNLGGLGDKVNVKSGYGRNFLIPSGKATAATDANLAEFEKRRAELEAAAVETLAKAEARQSAVSELKLTIRANAGTEGKLFGSVGAHDIVVAAAEAGVELTRQEIRLPEGPLRHIGEFVVDVHLHSDVNTQITLLIEAEDE